ncbi:MAG: signal peptidase II [bacterium]|nr:signal peptidase II [bacterium]
MSMKINISRKIFLPIIVLLVIGFVVLDQAVKKIAVFWLSASPFYISDYFRLEIYKNYGIAFGLPVNAGVFYIIIILFFAWLASGKLLNFREMGKREILAVSFILGGALGNIIDRVSFGYIIDFINFKDIVIFNLADVFIAIGVIKLLEKFLPDTGKGKFKKI